MSLSSILAAMDAEAESEIQAVSDQTAAAIAAIRSEAEKEAARIRGRYTHDAERQIDRERTRAINLARSRELREAAETLDRLFRDFVDAAGEQLSELRNTSAYSAIFARLADEALAEIGPDAVIHADPRDRAVAESLPLSAPVEFDLNTWGGAAVSTSDGAITVRNTLEARLDRVSETMRNEILALLDIGDRECIPDTTMETRACVQ